MLNQYQINLMNEDEDEPVGLYGRPPESFTDFVQNARAPHPQLHTRVSAPLSIHLQRSLENVAEIASLARQAKRRNSSGDSFQLDMNSDLYSHSPRDKKPLSTIIEQQSQILSGLQNQNDRSQNSVNLTNMMQSRSSNINRPLQLQDIQMQIVRQANSKNSSDSVSPQQEQKSSQSVQDAQDANQSLDLGYNAWVDKTFKYSMHSRRALLQSLNLKVHFRMNKVFLCLIFIIICLEQFIRTLATELNDPQWVQSYYTLAQQAICAISLVFVQIFQPSASKNSHFVVYFLELIIILVQPSFSPQTQQILGSNLMIQGFLVTSYINLFSSFAELTFLSMFFVVLNYRLRVQFYKQPHLQKCVKELLDDSSATGFSQANQNSLIDCYEQANWFDSLIFGTILFVVLCLHAHQFFRVEALQAQTGQPRQTESEFDKSNVGVYNCQTIQADSEHPKQLINSVDCSLAIVSFEKQTTQDQESQLQILFANQSFVSLLSGIDKDLKASTQKMTFQKCSFEKLSENIVLNGEEKDNKINESLSLDSVRNDDSLQTFSLSEIIFQLSNKVSIKETTVYVKLLLQQMPKSDTFDQSELNNSDQQVLLLKKQLKRSNHVDRQANQRGRKFRNYWNENDRVDTSDCLSFCKGQKIFELKVRPVLQQKKLCFSVQMTPINSTIYKVLQQAKVDLESLPKVYTNDQSLLQLKQVIKYSQLVEQQISEFSGVPSRTSIIDKSHSSNSLPDQIENIQAKDKTTSNWTNTVFARYQYYLSSVWCNAVHVAQNQKSQLNAWHVQNKSILLNFKKVSKQTQSIENHVKEFLIQFSQQIEYKNLHVSVGQGQMPMEPLFTDWKLYDQILFQVVSNSVKFNKVDGAIAVSIYFQKEVKDAVKNDYLMGNSSSPSSFEVGRIVTVVKDTGIGMSSLQQKELFRIKTLLDNKTKAISKGHLFQPKIEGVGLSTADVLVKCLGGSISVISKEECGTQVTFDVQVTTYPLNNRVPSYRYSDKGQTLTFPLMLKSFNSEPYIQSFQKARRASEDQKLRNPLLVDRSQRDSISDSESLNNEEEYKMFEKVFRHFDQIENKSDGHLYHPKPPETSFFNQDYYLDDSFLQRQNLNEKSSNSPSQYSQLLQQEELKQTNQMQQQKLVYDVISNKSSQMLVEDAQMKMENSHSQEPAQQTKSLHQQTITTNRILSFADMIRSSISKRSPLTAMVHSNPSIEYQRTPPTRKFNSSEFKKFQNHNSRLDNAFQQQSRRAKAPEYALSCDDITMKVAGSSKEIEIKSKEAKQLSDDRRILIERDIRLNKNKSSEQAAKEEVKQQLGSQRESDRQISSQQDQQKSLNFPLVFSSGVSSVKNIQQNELDERLKQIGDNQKLRHQHAPQDFTFQKGKSSNYASNSVDMMGRSASLSLPGGIQGEESSQMLKSDSIDHQVQISVEMDEQRNKILIQKLSEVGGSARNLLSRPLDQVDEVQALENSENQFSDLSIGESEHCFKILQSKGIVILNEFEKMSRLDEPPLQDRQRTLSGVLVNKGFLFGSGQNVKSSDQQKQYDKQQKSKKQHNSDQQYKSDQQLNQDQQHKSDQQLSLKTDEMKSKNQSNSLKSSEDKVQLLKFDKNPTDSSDSLEKKNLSNRLNQRKDLAKNVDEKMKSQFFALPSVKKMIDSKRQLKHGLSSSSNSRMCKCKSVLVITDDQETLTLIKEAVTQLDANGVDSAFDCQEAIKVLSLKLTAMCCTDSYALIFVTLERDFLYQNLVKRILETIELWNEKLASKGRSPIENPQIVGITAQPLKKSQKHGIDTVLTQPITSKQISDIFMTVGSYLL